MHLWMLRVATLVLAPPFPQAVSAEPPPDQLHKACIDQSVGQFSELFETASRQDKDLGRIMKEADKMASLLYQRCMLENGFRFHDGDRYCTAKLDEDLGPFDPLCYERVR
jgi:hypothetical protein